MGALILFIVTLIETISFFQHSRAEAVCVLRAMSYRAAGLTYLQYANFAAAVARRALRTDVRAVAEGRNTLHIKLATYAEGAQTKKSGI